MIRIAATVVLPLAVLTAPSAAVLMAPSAAVLMAPSAAVLLAPSAAADPNDLVPTCTGGQVPEAGECNPAPVEAASNPLEGVFGDAPGGSPNVQVGLTPQNQPVVLPLGVLPANLPVTLPLGITPPNVPATR